MSEIQKIEVNLDKRVETGAVQFNDDWPGTFIRGDNSFGYSLALRDVINFVESESKLRFQVEELKALFSDLTECNLSTKPTLKN